MNSQYIPKFLGSQPQFLWWELDEAMILISFLVAGRLIDKTCKIWIDPVLFKKYEVKVVPTFIYANNIVKDVELGSEGNFDLLERTPTFYKSVGDWSLSYHIEELKQLSNSKSLKKISDSLAEKNK